MRFLNTGGRQGRGDPPFTIRTRNTRGQRLKRWLATHPDMAFVGLVLLWAAFAFGWEWFMVKLAG